MRWLFGGNRRDDEDWEDLMENSTVLMSATVDPQGEGPIGLEPPKDTRTRVLVYGSPFTEMMADKAAEDRQAATSLGGHRLSVSRGSFGLRGSPLETRSQAAVPWPPVGDVVVSAPVVLAGGVLSSCRIDKVCVGDGGHALLLCSQGGLYAFGRNDHGQCGVGHFREVVHEVTPVRMPEVEGYSVSSMAAGAFHSVCLAAKDGQVYVWGHSDCLALTSAERKEAAGRSKGHISVPTRLRSLAGSSVVGAIAARERTSYALVARKMVTSALLPSCRTGAFNWAAVKEALVEQISADGVSLAIRFVHRGQLLCREEVGISLEVSGGTGEALSGRYFHNGEFVENRPVFMRRLAHSAGHEPSWIYFKESNGQRQWVLSTAAPGTEVGSFVVLSRQPLCSPLELCREGEPSVRRVGIALVGDSIYLRRDDNESHGLDGRYDRMDGLVDGTVGYALSSGNRPETVLVPNMAKGRWEIHRGATMVAFSTDAFNCALPWCMSQSIGLWYRTSGGVFRVEATREGADVSSYAALLGEGSDEGLVVELEATVRCCSIFHWGVSAMGQLLPTPKVLHQFPSDTEIVDVAAGGHFGLGVDRTGVVYGWGDGTYGELLSSKGATAVRRLDALVGFKARQVSCGARHSLVVDEQGSVVAFGDNTAGQCGLGSREGHRVKRPKVIPVGGGFNTAACGGRHSALMTAEGRLFTWGHGGDGKLIYVKDKYGPRSGIKEERVEGGDWEEEEDGGAGRRPPGVSIKSGLKAAVHRPRMVYTLAHLKVQAVGLGADSTVVVVGDSTAVEGGTMGSVVDGSTPGSASPLSVSRSSNPFRSRLFAGFGGFGSSPALLREDSGAQSLPLRSRIGDGSGSIDESIGADSFISAKESL